MIMREIFIKQSGKLYSFKKFAYSKIGIYQSVILI